MRSALAVISGTALLVHAAAPAVTPLGSYTEALQAPVRVAVDAAGQVYVTDTDAGRVTVFDAFGRVAAQHGGLSGPLGIAVDTAGRILVAETDAGCVSVFDEGWTLLYKLGTGDGEFQLPNHIAIDAALNTVYVTDSPANQVKVYAGMTRINGFGAFGTGNGQFDFPSGLCVSTNGEVFVVDQNNDRVQVFDRGGAYLRKYKYAGMLGPSGRKQGVVVDGAGRLYVADAFQGQVKVYGAANGSVIGSLGSFGPLFGQLSTPIGLAFDPFNRLLVASPNNRRIDLFGIDAFVHLTCDPSASAIATGSNLTLRAQVGGAGPYTFQWMKDGAELAGATNDTYAVAAVTGDDAGGYSVSIGGPSGPTASGVVRFTVVDPPLIVENPADQTVVYGQTADFAVLAAGAALTYQWKYYGRDIEGATDRVLSLNDVQGINAGVYTVEVRNEVGVALSAPASLSVIEPQAPVVPRGTVIIMQ